MDNILHVIAGVILLNGSLTPAATNTNDNA